MMFRWIAGLAAAVFAVGAFAQSYPVKPVRVIVTTVPGPLDTYARIVLEKMAERLKQPFVVENRAGAGGNVGADLVAKAGPDGYTLLFAIDTTFTVNPSLYRKMPFDVERDFAAISVPVTYGQMLAVHPGVDARSPSDLVALAKQKRLSYASGGNGSPSHLAMAAFLAAAGIEMTHIPYKGTGQSVIDVVGGQVDTIFAVVTGVYPQVRGQKLRSLGVSSDKRSPVAPEVPTIGESGFPGFTALFAYALMAPAGTPDDIVQALNREVLAAHELADVRAKNSAADYSATGLDARQSAAWLRDTRRKWAEVIQRAKITID